MTIPTAELKTRFFNPERKNKNFEEIKNDIYQLADDNFCENLHDLRRLMYEFHSFVLKHHNNDPAHVESHFNFTSFGLVFIEHVFEYFEIEIE